MESIPPDSLKKSFISTMYTNLFLKKKKLQRQRGEKEDGITWTVFKLPMFTKFSENHVAANIILTLKIFQQFPNC